MVSVAVSKVGKTSIVFVEPVAKVNSDYYCTRVLGQGMLPDITAKCGRYRWTLQQDGAPSHTARNTIAYLRRQNITFIEPDMWPPNSPDLNPVDYAIWGPCRSACTMVESSRTWNNLSRRSCWSGAHCHRGSLMAVSTSGGVVCRVSYSSMVDILNTSSTSCRHLYSSIVVCCRRYKR